MITRRMKRALPLTSIKVENVDCNQIGDGKPSPPDQPKPVVKKGAKKIKREVKTEDVEISLPLTSIKVENVDCNQIGDGKPIPPDQPKPVVKKGVKKIKREVKTEDVEISKKLPIDSNYLVGAHISAAGGLQNGPINAAAIGAKSFAFFLKSQRTWNSKPLEEKTIVAFKEQCQKLGFTAKCILPHGSYLLNCGSSKTDVLEKSRATLIDELRRCEKLGIELYNFHPGSTCGEIPIDECLSKISESINLAHSQTKFVITVVENMSCQGNTVGGKFEELRDIINMVKDKSRVGVCLDTCHAFAAGHDVSTPKGFEKVMKEFDDVIGLKYLKALHLNDSKGKLGCHLDRHENLGKGFIGKDCFAFIMNDSRFKNIPLILETPCEDDSVYEKEIKMLFAMEKQSHA